MSVRRSQAQKRAAYALTAIQALQAKRKDEYGNYRGFVRSLPAAIVASGLGQALAMELAGSKRDKGHELLFRHLSDWLCNAGQNGWASSPYRGGADIVAQLMAGDEANYIRAQEEAMALLVWLKKFAEAFLQRPDAEAAS